MVLLVGQSVGTESLLTTVTFVPALTVSVPLWPKSLIVIVGPEVGAELRAAGCVGGGVVRLLPDEDELQALSASRTAIPAAANERRVMPIPRGVAPLGSGGQGDVVNSAQGT